MKVGDWVRLVEPVEVNGTMRYYGKVVGYRGGAGNVTLQFPVRLPHGRDGKPVEADLLNVQLPAVEVIKQRQDACGPSVGGGAWCKSGSLESGGHGAYCTCDGCF